MIRFFSLPSNSWQLLHTLLYQIKFRKDLHVLDLESRSRNSYLLLYMYGAIATLARSRSTGRSTEL